jgi:flagellar biosynthesis/type III secretory pathway protein FliH
MGVYYGNCLIIIAIISQCGGGPSNKSSSNSGYDEGHDAGYTAGHRAGYDEGYQIGYREAERKYQNSGYQAGYNAARGEFQARINRMTADHENELRNSYNTGFTEGEVSMRNRITRDIEINAQNRIRQGDRNAILFDPKD